MALRPAEWKGMMAIRERLAALLQVRHEAVDVHIIIVLLLLVGLLIICSRPLPLSPPQRVRWGWTRSPCGSRKCPLGSRLSVFQLVPGGGVGRFVFMDIIGSGPPRHLDTF